MTTEQVAHRCGEGYAYRLRDLGHLFEAEDESKEWPELHAAIRQARQAYQADGTVPDWAALEDLVGDVRHAEQGPSTARPQPPELRNAPGQAVRVLADTALASGLRPTDMGPRQPAD